jgi:hypothetical protein
LEFQGRVNDNSLKVLASLKEIYADKLDAQGMMHLPALQALPEEIEYLRIVASVRKPALKLNLHPG